MTRAPPCCLLLLPFLAACGSGEWTVQIWGEDYIEAGIPAEAFDDGCSATFSSFSVEVTAADLLDGDGEVAGAVDVGAFELTDPGPQEVGTVSVPSGSFDTARFAIAPAGGSSVRTAGTLTCGTDSVSFDWSFDTSATYLCEPGTLTFSKGGSAETELTVHGDHLFYDALEDADAGLQGLPMVAADADGDGDLTLDELAAVDVASLGYSVGQYSDVTDLAAFVTHLTKTVGHVDGEGHCAVDL